MFDSTPTTITVTAGGVYRQLQDATANANLWLNLANTDDVGTYFDVKVDVLKNGAPVGSETVYCLTPPRVASSPVTVAVHIPGIVIFGPSDTFGLQVSARIGAGLACVNKGHKDGTLQLQYDSKTRQSNLDFGVGDDPTYLHQSFMLDITLPTLAKASTINVHPGRTKNGNPFISFGSWATTTSLPPL